MSLRKESIEKLREAVKNKAMGCYKGALNCLYYDSRTDSKCAVGVLIPEKTLDKFRDSHGDVLKFIDKHKSDSVISQLGKQKTFRGMKKEELIKMQELHDEVIQGNGTTKELEEYIFSLK